jgi:beta-galactosidase
MRHSDDKLARCSLVSGHGPRKAEQLAEWTFIDGDTERPVTVPHTWNSEDATDPTAEYERGRKVYHRQLEPLAEDTDRCLLHFEAANQRTIVRIDDKVVGTHDGGYTAFTFDVTEYLSENDSVSLEVSVDNSHDPNIPPLSMDYTFFGGIYRPVWRVETGDVAIDGREYGSSGVLVDTPTVSEESATVRARTTVTNHRTSCVSVEVNHRVVDDSGEPVAEFYASGSINPSDTQSFEMTSDPIENPDLWSPEGPHCYTVESTVTADGSVTDRIDSPLGINWIESDDNGQIRVNGEPVELRGTNRHQDRPGRGNALSDEEHLEDFERIADLGTNFLRLAHYPQSETMLHAADDEGILLWEEIPVVNYVTTSAAHDENCLTMLKEMIRQHYNHPSVAIWGLMNEILLHFAKGYKEELTEEMVESALELAEELNELAHEEDPDRLTAMACHHDWGYEKYGFVDVPDVLGWNLYQGWYLGKSKHIGGVLHEKLSARPTQPTIISEYGVGADPRLHTTDPEAWDFTEEYSSRYHEEYIEEFDSRGTDLAGTGQWNAFDFASGRRDDTIPDLNQKGLMTYDRKPKNTYHLYEAWLSNEPVAHIASRNWHRRSSAAANAGGTHPVKIYTNLPEVELFVDDESCGTKTIDDSYATEWDVVLTPGPNDVRVRATDGDGTVVEDEIEIEIVSIEIGEDDHFPDDGLHINAGSHREILTKETLWAPDCAYDAGTVGWGAVGGERISTLDRLYGTDLVPLYQHALEDLDAYRLDVPDGTYRVTLEICELVHEEPGRRTVTVTANGDAFAENVDPYAMTDRREPVSLTDDVLISDGNGLTLEFEATAGATLLNTISLTKY